MNGNHSAAVEHPLSRFPNNGHSGRLSGESGNAIAEHREGLGEALVIEQVAEILGCSAWTVRQRYLRQGLPYLQARPRGKLVFFRGQVTSWILNRQRQKGGMLR